MDAPPFVLAPCWLLLRIFSCLLPRPLRENWRQEWLAELWYYWQILRSRDERQLHSVLSLYRFCLGCWLDAWSQLALRDDRQIDLSLLLRSPHFCVALLSASVVCLGVFSNNFATLQTVLSELPYRHGPYLALVSRTGRLQAIRHGIPQKLADSWLAESRLLQAMAACSLVHSAPAVLAGRIWTLSVLQATPNLLDVIGQPVSPETRHWIGTGEPVAFLSFAFWQGELHQDPSLLGLPLRHNGRTLRIAGVLPPHFWFLSPSVQVYELDARALDSQPLLMIRCRPGVSARQLESELIGTAGRQGISFIHTAPHVLFLSDAVHTPIWLFGGALLIALVLVGIGHRFRFLRRRSHERLLLGNGRWWLFLFAKTGIALLLVFNAGLELFIGRSHQTATEALGGPALLWFYTVGCSVILLGALADQQLRCRVCLQCLAFPIRIGCPGCLLLEWSGTELLCPGGHGALYVPYHASCWDETEHWVALEL